MGLVTVRCRQKFASNSWRVKLVHHLWGSKLFSQVIIEDYCITRNHQSTDTHYLCLRDPDVQSVPFKMQPNNNHVLRYKLKSEAGSPHVTDSPNLPRVTRVKITLVARPLRTPVAQNLCRCEYGVFTCRTCVLFSNISSHRNRLLLFVKHLAMCVRVLTRKYRIRQQYTDR
jgi:hypothetical protein